MFTRCPDCGTVFHITAAELRAADGTVVCGACDATFDALETLSETRPAEAHEDEPVPQSPFEGDESPPGEDARDEDEFLQELESLIGDEDTPDDPLFDHAAPVAEQPGAPPAEAIPAEDEPALEPEHEPDGNLEYDLDDELEDELPDPDSVFRVDEPPEELHAPGGDLPAGTGEEPIPGIPSTPDQPFALVDEAPPPSTDDSAAEPAVSAAGEQEPAEQEENDDAMPGFARARRGGLWWRITLPLVAVLMLVGTWAHVQRGKLLRTPAGETVLGSIYSLLGMDVAPDWRPGEFRVLRSEAVASGDRPGTLSVAIEFQNGAAFAQPYPDIRVVLLDRFGQRVGTHDFEPEQYLESNSGVGRLPAGGRIRTSVAVPDPGARADGFRVDLCLELDARGLVCAAEPFR
jgi:predicted Zn finger-like uncharacterized protein